MARVAWVALVVVTGAAACTGGGKDETGLPPTSSTGTTLPTTTVDFSGVALPPVRGATTTTAVVIEGGRAVLGGTVTGPHGPVGGAVVRVERFVGAGTARADVPTGLDGTWHLDAIQGGRYRVRAWRQPDLAMTEAQVIFLQGTEHRSLTLTVKEVGGYGALPSVAPDPPVVDRQAELRVLVTFTEVDADGVARGVPQAGVAATLIGSGSWAVDTANPARTDASGVARWVLRCTDDGEQPLGVMLDTDQGLRQLPLDLPDCVPRSQSTTTTVPAGTTTTVKPTTTTEG